MIALGSLLPLVAVIGLFLLWKRKLPYSLPYLKTLRLMIPLPIVACILGWATTEMGRQPWIVQGQLRTVDAVSPNVTTSQVAVTLAILVLVYTAVAVVWLRVMLGIVRKGPA
jgi:cytochrome d ubiquinol oxidase subunit I